MLILVHAKRPAPSGETGLFFMRLQGRAERAGVFELFPPRDVAGFHHAAAEDLAQAPPADVLFQAVVPRLRIGEFMAFRRHEEHCVLDGIRVVRIALRHGEEPVEGGLQRAGECPVVHRRGEDHHVRRAVRGVDLFHIVPLHARVIRVLPAAPAAAAGMDVHAREEKFRHFVAGALRPFAERAGEEGRVPRAAGTAVQDDDAFAHITPPSGWCPNSGCTPWPRISTGRPSSGGAARP